MAKKYYYAVKKGKTPGIYFNWDDCKKQVTGFSGAVYKKFESIEEANSFIGKEDCSVKKNEGSKEESIKPKKDEVVAYVDGSYNIVTKECGYGVVLFSDKGKETFSRAVEIKEYSEFRNVTGEIFGSLYAIEKAIEYKAKKVYVHFDYTGISNWALGNWKTNNDLTKSYKKKYDILAKNIDVEFIKVAAHTGDTYNEEADSLAKKSVGV